MVALLGALLALATAWSVYMTGQSVNLSMTSAAADVADRVCKPWS